MPSSNLCFIWFCLYFMSVFSHFCWENLHSQRQLKSISHRLAWWHRLIITTTLEAGTGALRVQGQPRQVIKKLSWNLKYKINFKNRRKIRSCSCNSVVVFSMCKALRSPQLVTKKYKPRGWVLKWGLLQGFEDYYITTLWSMKTTIYDFLCTCSRKRCICWVTGLNGELRRQYACCFCLYTLV